MPGPERCPSLTCGGEASGADSRHIYAEISTWRPRQPISYKPSSVVAPDTRSLRRPARRAPVRILRGGSRSSPAARGGSDGHAAPRLAEAGATVVVADLDRARPEAAARSAPAPARRRRPRRRIRAALVGVDAGGARTARRLGERRGHLPHLAAARALRTSDWDDVLDINLRGTFLGAREAARAMIARGTRRRDRQRLLDRRLPRRRARRARTTSRRSSACAG